MGMYQHANGDVGELVLASISNPSENPLSRGKIRPVVLIERNGGHWEVMGLTTNTTFLSGKPRTPVPNPTRVGLTGPGYLWGNRLTSVSAIDLDRHLGYVDEGLAEQIILGAHLTGRRARQLRVAAHSLGFAS